MRRTGRLFFDKPSVDIYKMYVLQLFKEYFNWDEKTANFHQNELEHQLKMANEFL